jgi:cell division septation protein DedD
MTYRFAFDRKKLLVMIGAGLLAGLLLYAAGIFTGLALSAPTKSEIAALKARHASSNQQAAAPAPAPPQPVPVTYAPPPPAPIAAPAQPAAVEAAKPLSSAAEALGAESAPDRDVYSIQVGSFTDAKAARALQTDLRERGYPAAIFIAMDSDHKEWQAVRIGGFPTLSRASAAAGIFTNKERMQALVRRSSTL